MKTEPLLKTITALKTQRELEDLLQGLLTPVELEQILKRLQVIIMLKQGTPQREIASKLKVGIATVTRGSRMLKEGRFKYIKTPRTTQNWRS